MELIFFSILDILKTYFSENFPVLENEFEVIESNFLLEGLFNFQQAIESLSGTDVAIASAPVVLLAAGVTIFLGVAGEAFFKKTGIPDVAFLMVLGVIIGPILGIIKPDVVVEIVPYFAALALIIIMFDGGLNLDIRNIARTAHFALLLAILGFIVSVVVVMLLVHYGLGWEWLDSLLLGSIVGGSSSVVVFGLVRNFQVSEETKSMLGFESAITDILATIIAFIMFEAILTSQFNLELLGETIGRAARSRLGRATAAPDPGRRFRDRPCLVHVPVLPAVDGRGIPRCDQRLQSRPVHRHSHRPNRRRPVAGRACL